MQRGEVASGAHDTGATAGVCGCIPHPEHQEGGAVISGCVCEGVERVVQQTKRRSVTDVVKVVAFAGLLVALVLALALWL